MTKRGKQIVLLLFLLFFLIAVPMIFMFGVYRTGIPSGVGKHFAVVLDIRGSMYEYHPHLSVGFFTGRREPTLTALLSVIERASRDTRVEALVLRIYPSGAGIAKCEEMRQALHRFRETGKTVIAYSSILVNHHYMFACAADSLFMPPSGYLVITGPASSALFMRGAFDKLGIRPNIHRIGDYKSAAEAYTETKRTPAAREMTGWLLGDLFERFIGTIAAERDVGDDEVRRWIDRGLYSPARALGNGLIDGIRYWDEIRDSFEGKDIKLISMREYKRRRGSSISPGSWPKVAVIHAQGTIHAGESGFSMFAGPSMGSETIIRALRRARNDDRIKAVILRVDSPGGDGIAGDMISREVEITTGVKPVVVSMSDVAASGGYEVAYRADCIVAGPGSITGSIGSITGKLNMRGFYNKLGLTKDEIGTGEKSLLYSDYRDFTPPEWKTVEEEHWAFYRNWIAEIARFRGMTTGRVDSLARGRVWTGSQAEANGLIDTVGYFEHALKVACDLAGIGDRRRVALVHLPARMGIIQTIMSRAALEDVAAYALYRVFFDMKSPGEELFIRHELERPVR